MLYNMRGDQGKWNINPGKSCTTPQTWLLAPNINICSCRQCHSSNVSRKWTRHSVGKRWMLMMVMMNGSECWESSHPMTLRNHNISMDRPVQVSSVWVRLNNMDLDLLIRGKPMSPCEANISFPSPPIFRKFEELGVLTKLKTFMVEIPRTNVHVSIAIKVGKSPMLFSSSEKVMHELWSTNWVRNDIWVFFLSRITMMLESFWKRVMPCVWDSKLWNWPQSLCPISVAFLASLLAPRLAFIWLPIGHRGQSHGRLERLQKIRSIIIWKNCDLHTFIKREL